MGHVFFIFLPRRRQSCEIIDLVYGQWPDTGGFIRCFDLTKYTSFPRKPYLSGKKIS